MTLVKTYPEPQLLLDLLESRVQSLPPLAGESIDAARVLFEKIQYGGFGSAETRRSALYVLRHFPLSGAASSIASAATIGRLSDWIAPEPPGG